MDMRGYQHYREDAVNTMTQGELLLLLYDELVKRLTQAELALSKEDYPAFESAVDRSSLDHQYPISAQLTKLYEYFCYELSRVRAGRNSTELQRVKRMAGELRDSFRAADKRCASK